MTKKKWQWKKVHIVVPMVFFYVGCLAVLSFIGYSDGDDAFFLEHCSSMSLFSYLKWRYAEWTGRMAAEAIMHIFFNMDLWVWRIVNAVMLVVLPITLTILKKQVVPDNEGISANDRNRGLFISLLAAVLFYALLDIKAFGYSAIWITGSMNYLWPMVCGILTLIVVARVAFTGMNAKKVCAWEFATGSLCAVIATMSSEQMGAVLLAFEVICIAEKLWKKCSVGIGMVVMTVATVGSFLISSLSPGNELRIAMAVEHNMPQFESLSLSERFFMLTQWLVSSFANENVLFLIAIWLVGIGILWFRLKSDLLNKTQVMRAKAYLAGSVVFAGVALSGKCGVTAVIDMGINLAEMTGLVERVPVAADMSGVQWAALAWWFAAMAFTLFFLWEVSDKKWLVLFTYMGAVACEVILILSPTIYSSGERVFFIAGLMLMFIVLLLYEQLPKGKMHMVYVSALIVLGIGNLALQAMELLTMIAG